jgi:hypothetical protein
MVQRKYKMLFRAPEKNYIRTGIRAENTNNRKLRMMQLPSQMQI